MKSYKERREMIRAYADKNKLFSVVVAFMVVFIIGSAIVNKISDYRERKTNDSDVSVVTEVPDDTSVDTNINEKEKEKPHWRFYWSDLIILLGGGGFCVYKIIEEKRKAREKL